MHWVVIMCCHVVLLSICIFIFQNFEYSPLSTFVAKFASRWTLMSESKGGGNYPVWSISSQVENESYDKLRIEDLGQVATSFLWSGIISTQPISFYEEAMKETIYFCNWSPIVNREHLPVSENTNKYINLQDQSTNFILGEIQSNMSSISGAKSVLSGSLFGAALTAAGVYSPTVIVSQMKLESFHMLKVFLSASASSS